MKKKFSFIPIITVVVIIAGIAYYAFSNSESTINKKYEEYKNTQGAVLIDIREEEEYIEGHIDGSVNIPASSFSNIEILVVEKSTPIYLYGNSNEECASFKDEILKFGYTNIVSMGNVDEFNGKLIKSDEGE